MGGFGGGLKIWGRSHEGNLGGGGGAMRGLGVPGRVWGGSHGGIWGGVSGFGGGPMRGLGVPGGYLGVLWGIWGGSHGGIWEGGLKIWGGSYGRNLGGVPGVSVRLPPPPPPSARLRDAAVPAPLQDLLQLLLLPAPV